MKIKLLLLLLIAFTTVSAQNATFYNGFESVTLPTGWAASNGVTRTTAQPCSGVASMTATSGRFSAVEIKSPSYISDGQKIYLSLKHKTNVQGIIYIEYSIDNSTWVTVASTSTATTNCLYLKGEIAENAVPAGNNVWFRILTYNPSIANNTYFFDDFAAVQTNETVNDYSFDNTLLNKFGGNAFSTNAGITFVNDRHGNANAAVNFANGGITAAMPQLPYGNSPRTVSIWAKLNQFNNDSNGTWLYYYGGDGSNFASGGRLKSTEINHFGQSPNHIVSATNVIDTWDHYVFSYDGTNSKIFKNGALVESLARNWSTVNNNLYNFLIGSPATSNQIFNGSIDDLKIYNVALTDAQVQNLYSFNQLNSTGAPLITAVSASSVTLDSATINYTLNTTNSPATSVIKYGLTSTSLTSQMTGFSTNNTTISSLSISGLQPNTQYFYQIESTNSTGTSQSTVFSLRTLTPLTVLANYTFDNTLSDVNGANAFAFNNGLSYGTDRLNIANKALFINGTGTTAFIPNIPVGNSSRTFSFWIKPTQSNGANRIFSYGSPTGSAAYGASFDATRVYNFSWTTNLSFLQSTSLNVWKHIVCTYEQSTSTASLYTDGVLRASITANWSTANNGMFYLGSLFGETGSRYIGFIDDLQIYDVALTAQEIANLFTNNTVLSTENFNQNNLEVSLFPNPVLDILNIKTENEIKSLEIYTIQGQKVKISNQKQLNVSDLAKGIYLVKIQNNENSILTKKFIKD